MRAMTDERRRAWTLVLCCLAQFMVILDVSIVNVALPSIAADLGFTPASLAWVVNGYTLAFAGFLLLGGRAADLLGRREVFAAGLGLFALASLAGGLAQSELTLVAARAAQGLGGAVVAPASLSILMNAFTEGAERNRALGYWGAMGAIGGASGALLGGLLTQALDWRWILFINVPIGIAGALAALRIVRTAGRDTGAARDFDLAGALSATIGLVIVTYGIVETESHGWGSARTLLTLAVGFALLGLFVLIEGRFARHPLVPLRIFRSRELSGANIVVFCLGAAVFAMWYFLSLYLQEVLGYTPIEAGLAFLPMPLTIAACTQVATRLTDPLRRRSRARVRDDADRDRHADLQRARRPRHVPRRRAAPLDPLRGGDRLLVRAGDDRRHGRRRAPGGRARLRARQHVASDGRLGRARAARRDRHPGLRRRRAPAMPRR